MLTILRPETGRSVLPGAPCHHGLIIYQRAALSQVPWGMRGLAVSQEGNLGGWGVFTLHAFSSQRQDFQGNDTQGALLGTKGSAVHCTGQSAAQEGLASLPAISPPFQETLERESQRTQ